jgi:hypothetical protein
MVLLGATVVTTACGSGDETGGTGQPASSGSATASAADDDSRAKGPSKGTTGTMATMATTSTGSGGTPTTRVEPDATVVPAYGVTIVEPTNPGGSGGRTGFAEPLPDGVAGAAVEASGGSGDGTALDAGPEPEPEPLDEALAPEGGAGGARAATSDAGAERDAGPAAEPEPMLEPEPMAVALYGVTPLARE